MKPSTAVAIGGATAGVAGVAGVAAAIYKVRKSGSATTGTLLGRDRARRVDYYSLSIPHRPGAGFELLAKLKEGGVNLIAYTVFPLDADRAKMSLVPESSEALVRVAQRFGMSLSPRKDAFFVQGKSRVGAAAEILQHLAQAGINVTASCGAEADGNYGLTVWVKPTDVQTAARALGAD